MRERGGPPSRERDKCEALLRPVHSRFVLSSKTLVIFARTPLYRRRVFSVADSIAPRSNTGLEGIEFLLKGGRRIPETSINEKVSRCHKIAQG